MSDYHNTHWVTFYKQSVFSALMSIAVNCFTFDALSHLSDNNANLFFCTGHGFVCCTATHHTEMCPVWGYHMLFGKCLDNPHHEWLFDSVRGHLSISLPLLPSPTLPLFICIPPLTSVPSPGITPKANDFHAQCSDDFLDVDSPEVDNFQSPPLLGPE
jgi:hypothetical protein